MGSQTALIHRKRGFTCLWLVGGGVFQTEQAGRETCALTFWHKEDVEDPCGARALLVSVVITMTESLKLHILYETIVRRSSQNKSDPHPSRKQGQSSQEAGGLPFFPYCCYC